MDKEQFKTSIKTGYANILKQSTQNKLTKSLFQCCNPKDITKEVGRKIGYSEEQLTNNGVGDRIKGIALAKGFGN